MTSFPAPKKNESVPECVSLLQFRAGDNKPTKTPPST